MKKILSILADYYKTHFKWVSFLLCALLGAVLIFFAYDGLYNVQHIGQKIVMRENPYQRLIEHQQKLNFEIIGYCVLYFIAFAGAFFLQAIAEKDFSVFKSGRWWFLTILAIIMFSVRGSSIEYQKLFFSNTSSDFSSFYRKISYNLGGLITIIIPCFIYWFFTDRKEQPFYGFHTKGVTLKPYFVMLAIMLPFILWAGTQADFLESYPNYVRIYIAPNNPLYKWCVAAYELAYGSDFVFTEFFFRGFLILAFAKKFGHKAILPMCVFYITIHFGKPLGETISSFFGGLLLGVIAFRTRSIYGGIIIHLGIAYLMELVAMLAKAGCLHF